MVVEAAPVIPREEDRGAVPVGAVHDRVHDPRHPRLPDGDRVRRVFAAPIVGHDPRDRREGPLPRIPEVGTGRLDVRDLVVLPYRLEAGKRVPDARGRCRLRPMTANDLPIGAIRLGAVHHEVAPAHVRSMQEIGEVGPRVRARAGDVAAFGSGDLVPPESEIRRTRHGVVGVRTPSAPPGDKVEMRWQAPRAYALEQMILQDEATRICPVVRDLGGGVVTDHVRDPSPLGGTATSRCVGIMDAEPLPARAQGLNEAIHASAVDVCPRSPGRMRAAEIDQVRVVERADALPRVRVRDADGRFPASHRDTVRTGECPEIVVERTVLLHDDDDVLDLLDAPGDQRPSRDGLRGDVPWRDHMHEHRSSDQGEGRTHDRATDQRGRHRPGCAVRHDLVRVGTETSSPSRGSHPSLDTSRSGVAPLLLQPVHV